MDQDSEERPRCDAGPFLFPSDFLSIRDSRCPGSFLRAGARPVRGQPCIVPDDVTFTLMIAMAQPICTDCQRRMEGGFLLDNKDHGGFGVGTWVEGPPEKSFWTGLKIGNRRRLTIYAWRCPGCSQVRLYAPE